MLPRIRSTPCPCYPSSGEQCCPGGATPRDPPILGGSRSPQTPSAPPALASAATGPSAAGGTAASTGRLGELWSRASVKVGALTVAAALVYCLDSLILFRRFLASTFDLVIFDQGIRGYAHFQAPISIARGVSDGEGAHFMLLADHWSPVLALFAPLYWIYDRPATLLVAQGVLFALAIPPLWAYTRRQLGPGAAYFVCVAYALSLPVMEAVIFDFHEVAFVPVLTAVMVERFDAGRRWHGILAAVALLLVKEDMGLLVAGFGGYLLLTRRRWTGLAFIAGGMAATWVATHLLIPAFGGSATFYWAYGQFGSTLGSALLNVITHPLHALHVFITPWVKARTMIGLLAMFGFLPLASPMVVAVLPLLAERMLASGYPLWWQAKFQYDAFLVMMLCCAAVDGAARLQRRWPERWDKLLTYPARRPAWLRGASPGGRPRSPPTGGTHPPDPPCASRHHLGRRDLRRRPGLRPVLAIRPAAEAGLLRSQRADAGGRGGHRTCARRGRGGSLQQHRPAALRPGHGAAARRDATVGAVGGGGHHRARLPVLHAQPAGPGAGLPAGTRVHAGVRG